MPRLYHTERAFKNASIYTRSLQKQGD
jgi:hypothetical protein